MINEEEKRAKKQEFYRLLTKFYGWSIATLSALFLTFHLLNGTASIPYILFSFVCFATGRYIQKTAYQD